MAGSKVLQLSGNSCMGERESLGSNRWRTPLAAKPWESKSDEVEGFGEGEEPERLGTTGWKCPHAEDQLSLPFKCTSNSSGKKRLGSGFAILLPEFPLPPPEPQEQSLNFLPRVIAFLFPFFSDLYLLLCLRPSRKGNKQNSGFPRSERERSF